ncbi:MAG: DUF2934 domain-containing protein [Acidobacteriia bacterium]|nr:DUF2934 domain-containing protein [Terriglobia bacterium]
MAKQQHTTIRSGGTGAAAASAVEPVAEPESTSEAVAETAAPASAPEPEQIARLAYSYWQARGCREGSPVEDWLRAEGKLRQPAAGTKV